MRLALRLLLDAFHDFPFFNGLFPSRIVKNAIRKIHHSGIQGSIKLKKRFFAAVKQSQQ